MGTHEEREARVKREVDDAYSCHCVCCLDECQDGDHADPLCERGPYTPRYIHDPDPEYYGGPDYDLARDMDRGK